MRRGLVQLTDEVTVKTFTIGEIVGTTFRKRFTWNQAFRKLGYAYPMDCEVLTMLKQHGVELTELHERISDERLLIRVDDWMKHGQKLLSPATKSARWYLTRDQMRQLNLLNKKATNGGTVAQREVVSHDQCTGKTANCQAES